MRSKSGVDLAAPEIPAGPRRELEFTFANFSMRTRQVSLSLAVVQNAGEFLLSSKP